MYWSAVFAALAQVPQLAVSCVCNYAPSMPMSFALLKLTLTAQVGAGALGCEFLKNFALMGTSCGEQLLSRFPCCFLSRWQWCSV